MKVYTAFHRTVFMAAGIGFAWVLVVYGWNSVGPYTHEKIADDAIKAVSKPDYPDIHRFAEELRNGSETEAHDPPGDQYKFDVWASDPALWWDKQEGNKKGALILYKEYAFDEAYERIGYICHLIQDDRTPAHIRICAHGYWGHPTDDLEDYVDAPAPRYGYGPPVDAEQWKFTDKKGFTWYYWLDDTMDDDDEDNQPDGPGGGGQIIDGPGNNPQPAEENWGVGSCNFGTYGYGDYWFGFDPLPGKNKGYDYFQEYPNPAIAHGQLKLAYRDTIDEMKARSIALPPLVPDDETHGRPSISAKVFGPNKPVDVSFVAMENRKKTVLVSILADAVAIKDTAGKVWDGGADAAYDLETDPKRSSLPWKATLTRSWKGDLADGQLVDGRYTVKMKVKDQDGNLSEERTRTVKFDKTKPRGTITVNVMP